MKFCISETVTNSQNMVQDENTILSKDMNVFLQITV
jgi:hypothetical protein